MPRGEKLIPLNKRSYEEMRAIQKKGNEVMKKKAEKRKLMKEQLDTLLSLKLSKKNNKELYNRLSEAGFADGEIDNQLALLMNIFTQALQPTKESIQAAQFIRDTNGQSPTQKQLQVQTDLESYIKNIEGDEF